MFLLLGCVYLLIVLQAHIPASDGNTWNGALTSIYTAIVFPAIAAVAAPAEVADATTAAAGAQGSVPYNALALIFILSDLYNLSEQK